MRLDELIINQKASNREQLQSLENGVKAFLDDYKDHLDEDKVTRLNGVLKKIADLREQSGDHWQDSPQVTKYINQVSDYIKKLKKAIDG